MGLKAKKLVKKLGALAKVGLNVGADVATTKKARKLKELVRVAKAARDASQAAGEGVKVAGVVTTGAKIGSAAGPAGTVVGALGGYGFYRMKKGPKRHS